MNLLSESRNLPHFLICSCKRKKMNNFAAPRTLNDASFGNLKNQRVLLRADFNVPIDKSLIVNDSECWRIKAVIPTIEYLLKKRAKIIILSHLGRPGGKIDDNLRLDPVQKKLSELLNAPVRKMRDSVGEKIKRAISEMAAGEILMLENLRFHKEEEENNENFAKELSGLGDFYVNDAFADSHRNHASISAIAKFLPSCAGLLMEREIKILMRMLNPAHPATAIIGGVKLETKLPVVQELAKIYDNVLVGGMIANEIMQTSVASIIMPNVILPIPEKNQEGKILDIGENSVKLFSKFIHKSKTIVWNGAMGVFEDSDYDAGTKGVINSIKFAHKNGATVLMGGGETVYSVQKFAPELMDKKIKNFYISTGGGAMLEFLSGKKLPGIEALYSK